MKYPKYNLYDDTYTPTYDEYVETCDNNGIEPQGENSEGYWDYIAFCQQNYWDDLKINLKCSMEAMQPCLVTGSLGLWDGRRTIYPTRCDNLLQAIQRCCGHSIDNIVIDVEDGVVNVKAMHHDGTNHFYIQPLSKKGLKATANWYDGNAGCEEYKSYWVKKYNGYLY